MRLSKFEQKAIKETFDTIFNDGQIFLFGSRVDDNQAGGDIDLYLKISDINSKEELFEKKIKFLSKLKQKIGDQKIDIIFNEDMTRPIEQEARKWAIAL